jgi:tetratricopeptide (TPR) repeat protein
VPLPDDRSSLLSLAAEAEGALAETKNAEDEKGARKHAFWLRRLAALRWKLGDLNEAATLFGESAEKYIGLDSPDDETAAKARIEQSTALMANGQNDASLRVIQGLTEGADGFPEFANLTAATRRSALAIWGILLQKRGEFARLYEVSGIALVLLDATDPMTDRYDLAKTLVSRAKAAEALGYGNEAAETYEQAIGLFEELGPSASEGQVLEAMHSQALLLSSLGRKDELTIVWERILRLFGERTEPSFQRVVKAARKALEVASGSPRTRRWRRGVR